MRSEAYPDEFGAFEISNCIRFGQREETLILFVYYVWFITTCEGGEYDLIFFIKHLGYV